MSERNTPLSFRAVEVFVAVVEQGSVSGAAKRLGLSPSTVSQQLSNLEQSLGARLIERSARTFMITSAGDVFLPRAQKLLDDVSGARAALAGVDQAPQMTLRIAMIEDLDLLVTPHWLTTLTPALERCRFAIRSGASHENHSALADRSVDMIVAVDAAEPVDWVEGHALLADPYILVTARSVPEDADLDSLMRYPMIRYAREQYMARQIEAQLRRVGATPARGYEITGSQGALALVAATGGWAITTAFAYLGTGATGVREDVLARPLPLPAFSRSLSLYARRDAFGDLPALCAEGLRASLERTVVGPGRERLAFVGDALRTMSD